jgi:hypothetical protein
METVIQIENETLSEELFEHKEQVPDSFYVQLMDMLKLYHEGAHNEHQIYSILVDNIDTVDPYVMKILMKKMSILFRKHVIVVNRTVMWPSYFFAGMAVTFFILNQWYYSQICA